MDGSGKRPVEGMRALVVCDALLSVAILVPAGLISVNMGEKVTPAPTPRETAEMLICWAAVPENE